ncbi:MAG: VOC family protein [Comamonadaceae bacterium]|nr:VOC family protein [Comamonadaceae bacterium]
MTAHIDHLVVAAATLEEGVAWCESTLGVVPGPGGEHALFGTHNRLLKLHSDAVPPVYLEIIAINPQAQPTRAANLRRWFDLDDPTLRHRLQQQGPQLVHWVARVPGIESAVAALHVLDIDRGAVLQASRPTPEGLLQWRISVRDDGQRLFDGALPTLIEWGDTHPASTMSDSGLTLTAFEVSHPQAPELRQALHAIGLAGVPVSDEPPTLVAQLQTPKGRVTLASAL